VLAKLLDAGLPHKVVDVSVDLQARGFLNLVGAKSVPVVVADGYNPIVGYEPILLKYLIETYPREEINV
jgi:hypothetical protein